MMKPAKVLCDSASANTRLVMASASAPPYSPSNAMPSNPAWPMRRNTSRGTMPVSSHAAACGSTSRSRKRATWSRSSSWSGLS
ncbi:hypothetical protein D9M69_695640 [compost metagenome]